MHELAELQTRAVHAALDADLEELQRRGYRPSVRQMDNFMLANGHHRTKDGDENTNIFIPGRAMFNLPADELGELLTIAEAARRAGVPQHIMEKQWHAGSAESGAKYDFDLVLPADVPQSKLALDMALTKAAPAVVTRVANAIQRVVDVDDQEVTVFVIAKPEPVPYGNENPDLAGKAKYGFHVVVPAVRMTKGAKRKIIEMLRNDPALRKALGVLGSENAHDALDQGSATFPPCLFGSCKPGKSVTYQLKAAFRASFAGLDFGVPDIMRVGDAELADESINLVAEMALMSAGSLETKLKFTAHRFVPELRPEVAAALAAEGVENTDEFEDVSDDLMDMNGELSTLAVTDPEVAQLHRVLAVLTDEYAEDYNLWWKTVVSIANTSANYRTLAEWFSSRYSRWEDPSSQRRDKFETVWTDAVAARSRGAGYAYSRRWIYARARECDKEKFFAVTEEGYFRQLVKAVVSTGGSLEHAPVARVLHMMLGGIYCTDIDPYLPRSKATHEWFQFVTEGDDYVERGQLWKWRPEPEIDGLHGYISDQFPRLLSQVEDYFNQRLEGADGEKSEYYDKLLKEFRKNKKKVQQTPFKDNVIKESKRVFRRRGFVRGLDKSGEVMGVENGVLVLPHFAGVNDGVLAGDLEAGAAPEVVPARLLTGPHEYAVMRSAAASYVAFDPQRPTRHQREVLDLFRDVFVEPDVLLFMMFYLATSLSGGSKEGILLTLTAGGRNGKTVVMQLVKNVHGEYGGKLAMQLLTAGAAGTGPESAKMAIKGMRFCYFDESKKNDVLDARSMKELASAGGEITGNEKFKVQETFMNTCTLVLATNYPLKVDDSDYGTWRRQKRYGMKRIFRGAPDPNNPFEQKDDPAIVKHKIKSREWKDATLSILVYFLDRLFREYDGEISNVPCPTIDRETDRYRREQDRVHRFICEKVVVPDEHTDDPATTMQVYTLRKLVGLFGEWDTSGMAPDDVATELENSSLTGNHMRFAANGEPEFYGMRVLAADENTPGAGERLFNQANDAMEIARAARELGEFLKRRDPNEQWWLPAEN